ncbi:hypothetical protein Pan153_38480 [Gimesia panareensis]|uniref:Carboxypeptidase regulatory-like domain-containing protein n=1 Tax=Gimesia panareensis TaxID=2527978 RepID=A0A518FSB0_9PLAN|nr:hypothetical protein [Gimesia panareensis]QDV19185.1 hypothetical protein Pan153_38480 [Gimesia panareensis]
MQQTYRRCGSILLLTLVLILPGCSLSYNLILEGQLLAGPQQLPVKDAKIILVIWNSDMASTVTDSQGNWKLEVNIGDVNFQSGKDGRYWLIKDRLKLRIEAEGTTYSVPCPRVPEPESGGEIYSFVMTVLDAHPEPESETPQVEELPLEAVKPSQSASDGGNGSGIGE